MNLETVKIRRQCLVCGEVCYYTVGDLDAHCYRIVAGEFYFICPGDRNSDLTVNKSRLIEHLKPARVEVVNE